MKVILGVHYKTMRPGFIIESRKKLIGKLTCVLHLSCATMMAPLFSRIFCCHLYGQNGNALMINRTGLSLMAVNRSLFFLIMGQTHHRLVQYRRYQLTHQHFHLSLQHINLISYFNCFYLPIVSKFCARTGFVNSADAITKHV